MFQRNLFRRSPILATLALTAVVAMVPAHSFSLWDYLVSLLELPSAGVRIDDNGIA